MADDRTWTTDDVLVTAGGQKRTLAGWLGHDVEAATTAVTDLDGHPLDFDDVTGHPADVRVWVDGRPS